MPDMETRRDAIYKKEHHTLKKMNLTWSKY